MKKTILIVSIVWLILVSALFAWNYTNAKREQETIAFQTAKSFFDQVLISRAWNAAHGGVYVPITSDTQPNPYLDDPLRDIQVNKQLKLTKINPSFMTRQIADIADKQNGIRFHITSLNPLRPENTPTPREELALKEFEKGVLETGQIFSQGPNNTFFYMAPLKTEKACLRCHAKQGYKQGSIRGGISVTLPFVTEIPLLSLVLGHLVVGIGGVLGVFFFGTKLNHAYEIIRNQAATDVLTGIPNRRSFIERILTEFPRSQRTKHPLSIVMADIDNFKSYNDTFGHKRGDECLRYVAAVLKKEITRPGDLCARYGGEEFILILPDTPQQGAVVVAEKIRAAIYSLAIPHEKSKPDGVVTVSLGVTTTDTTAFVSYEQLIEQADKALYLAKEHGRNRVEVFSSNQ